ncbi:hypothetical protein KSF78_0004691 [Schistosoma japonicum]|nr:hypothetical protein KSF78_0004691 [Schistosoma japonicum]KAH8875605.1 hypothetical protein KSF78_0004691 [Schistosoma japonicum]
MKCITTTLRNNLLNLADFYFYRRLRRKNEKRKNENVERKR